MTRLGFQPYFEKFVLIPHTHVEMQSAFYQATGEFAGQAARDVPEALSVTTRHVSR